MPDSKLISKQHDALVKKAMTNAGVADLMELYEDAEMANRENDRVRQLLEPVIITSTSNSSL